MDFIQKLHSTPFLFLVAFILVCESCLVFLVGFVANDWFTLSSSTYGLWKYCVKRGSDDEYECKSLGSLEDLYKEYEDSIRAARFFCFVSLGCQVATAGLLVSLFVRSRKMFATLAYAACFAASATGIIGAAVFMSDVQYKDAIRSWGGVLVIIVAIIQAHAAVCIVLPIVRGQVVFEDSQPQAAPIGGSQGVPGKGQDESVPTASDQCGSLEETLVVVQDP
ncbi:hypothetical protein BaRGS_00023742 [Batillaria attramentaria]|uniref:Uncharacterized protein n=1 Tax=Batillaria attramentaria TaxID=370345 RepID=A0ABD0KCZ2_9CAEN